MPSRRLANYRIAANERLFEITIWLSVLHHLLAIGIESVIDDPLCCIDLVIVFVAEMAKTFSDGFEPGPFRLAIERVVRVCCVDDFSEQDERRIMRKLVFLQDGFKGAFFTVVA